MTALADLSQQAPIPTAGIADKAVTSSKQLLDVQIDKGTNAAYKSAVTNTPLDVGTGTTDLAITYTPTVDCWWEVVGFVGLLRCDSTGGVPSYFYAQIQVSGTLSSAYGTWPATSYAIGTQAGDNGPFTHRTIKALFPLTAGVAYGAKIYAQMVGAWSYYPDAPRLNITGKAWAR